MNSSHFSEKKKRENIIFLVGSNNLYKLSKKTDQTLQQHKFLYHRDFKMSLIVENSGKNYMIILCLPFL